MSVGNATGCLAERLHDPEMATGIYGGAEFAAKLIAEYDNKFSAASWKPLLTYDAQASADRLTKPVLMVGSPSIALPAGAAADEARMKAPLERVWLGEDVTQFDFYDRKDAVTAAADAVAEFLAA